MSRRKRIAAAALLIFAGLVYFGYPYVEFARLWFGVVGVDVSHHQGDIDWRKLSKTDVRFAYIKATEGGDYVDPMFQQNWKGARAAGLAVGAYHFFTRCKTGADQAKNFLAVLPPDADALPPVLDAEKMEPCDDAKVDLKPLEEIQSFISAIEAKLGCRPILYITGEFEVAYLGKSFRAEAFWVRSVLAPPLPQHKDWIFWQYLDAGSRAGVDGPLDLDVFRGTPRDFEDFRKASICFKKVTP